MNTPKLVIMCVDDEKIVLDSLNRQLQRHFHDAYEFEFAESAEEAIKTLDELSSEGYSVAMIISDQIMPGMSGDQFLTHIHQKLPKPIKILLTGQASLDSAIKAINNANLYRYICKPWSEDDFLLTVEKGLQQYVLSEQTHKQIEVFSHFFPGQFLECLSKESMLDVHLGDHVQKEMTVLFSDIRNFTTLSESMTPEENFSFINNYLSYIEPAINKNRGFIDKYIGDAILALFENPEDALNAALDMQKGIASFNRDYSTQKYHPVTSGIGLHTGTLMLGIVGVEKRVQGTVIADAVNLAARMQDLSPLAGGQIIASGSFIDNLQKEHMPHDNIRFLGKIFVKGKKEAVPVYEILTPETDPSGALKMNTKELFAEGISLFLTKQFAEACVKFKRVLDQNPSDKCAQRYLQIAAKYMLEGVPDDWEGIHLSNSHHK